MANGSQNDWWLMDQMFRRLGIDSPPIPDEPTDALPGTEAKLNIMRDRIRDGRQPHHPDDAKRDFELVGGMKLLDDLARVGESQRTFARAKRR